MHDPHKMNTEDKDTNFKMIPQSIEIACTYIAKAALVYRKDRVVHDRLCS